PALAKGLVKREVTRIVTPGTLTDDALLDPRENNFLAAFFPEKDRAGLAWLELSTGRFVATDVELRHLDDELARLQPAECLVPEGTMSPPLRKGGPGRVASQDEPLPDARATPPSPPFLRGGDEMVLTQRAAWCFSPNHCKRVLLDHFGTQSLAGFGWDGESPAITAAGALLEYAQETQKASLQHIVRLEPYTRGSYLLIDEATRRSLELTCTLRDGRRDGSLLAVIDETVSP